MCVCVYVCWESVSYSQADRQTVDRRKRGRQKKREKGRQPNASLTCMYKQEKQRVIISFCVCARTRAFVQVCVRMFTHTY